MLYKSKALIFLIITMNVFSIEKIETKQSLSNIRFISYDNRYTIYQKRSGDLSMVNQNKIETLFSSDGKGQYQVSNSQAREKLLVEFTPMFFERNTVMSTSEIYTTSYKKPQSLIKHGEGISARLHLNDNWLSFYRPKTKHIVLQNLGPLKTKKNISLNVTNSPYFSPQVVMLDETTVLYTDINQKLETGLIYFDRRLDKMQALFKSTPIVEKFEICLTKNYLILGRFSYEGTSNGSSIEVIQRNKVSQKLKLDDFTPIYQSEFSDQGQMLCDAKTETIYFIKTLDKNKNQISSINIKNKKLSHLASDFYFTNLFNMDGRILTQYLGELFIIKGPKGVEFEI